MYTQCIHTIRTIHKIITKAYIIQDIAMIETIIDLGIHISIEIRMEGIYITVMMRHMGVGMNREEIDMGIEMCMG